MGSGFAESGGFTGEELAVQGRRVFIGSLSSIAGKRLFSLDQSRQRVTRIDDILDKLADDDTCLMSPPCGLPQVAAGLRLPADVARFYERAGGMVLRKDGRCGSRARVVTPQEFDRIDIAIVGEMFATGPFEYWHAIVDVEDGDYLAIDIGPDQSGKCLDCFHETFACRGYVSVVASSFTDLLMRIINHQDDSAFWLQDEFEALGEGFALYGYQALA